MFQDFTDPPRPTATPPRIAALRNTYHDMSIDGFIVPHGDEYQNEYLPACAERLAWITGFTGSAGLAIIMQDQAAIFVDGRYTLQVKDQIDETLFDVRHLVSQPPEEWIATQLTRGTRLGYDPHLHTGAELRRFQTAAETSGTVLVACETNPIDSIWIDQPAFPRGAVQRQPLSLTGMSSAEKRKNIRTLLAENKADAVVITRTDSIAWLFNIRGKDVPHTPLVLAYAIVYSAPSDANRTDTRAGTEAELFIDLAKLTPHLAQELEQDARLHSMDELEGVLNLLGSGNNRVALDPEAAPVWFQQKLESSGAVVVDMADPCQLPKALKTPVELSGTRQAHIRDGAALSRFLCWIKQHGPTGEVSEIDAARKLENFRRESNQLIDISFDTISGSGPHGAVVHYRVTEASDRKLQEGELYLVDSGGQYLDGTTDVTRTLALGTPTAEMKDRFTRVLKGHINLASARFPEGTTGVMLDALARQFLWQAGLDYDHGTGHGVGVFLGVHEGPQSISRRPVDVALQPGMIVSNEPGYYKTDAYGIRIENLVRVTEPQPVEGGERAMLGFENLTLAPIDADLIDLSLLTPEELAWLNDYHQEVRETLVPIVDPPTRIWLEQVCAPLETSGN